MMEEMEHETVEMEDVEKTLLDIERIDCKRRLKHHFSDEEKLELGTELARELGDLNGFEDELKDVKSSYKAKIESAQANINLVQQKVYSGYEYQMISCEMTKDYRTKEVRVLRLDTGEEVERRVMTQDELQQSLV